MARIAARRSFSSTGEVISFQPDRKRYFSPMIKRRQCDEPRPSAQAASPSEHPPGNRVELLQEGRIARLRCRDQSSIERTVGADRARLVLVREIAGEAGDETRRLLGVRGQDLDDVLDGGG